MPAIRRLIPQPEPPLTHTQDLSLSWLCLNQPATASSTLVKTIGAESVHPNSRYSWMLSAHWWQPSQILQTSWAIWYWIWICSQGAKTYQPYSSLVFLSQSLNIFKAFTCSISATFPPLGPMWGLDSVLLFSGCVGLYLFFNNSNSGLAVPCSQQLHIPWNQIADRCLSITRLHIIEKFPSGVKNPTAPVLY